MYTVCSVLPSVPLWMVFEILLSHKGFVFLLHTQSLVLRSALFHTEGFVQLLCWKSKNTKKLIKQGNPTRNRNNKKCLKNQEKSNFRLRFQHRGLLPRITFFPSTITWVESYNKHVKKS